MQQPPTAVGAIVMAVGIFGIAALPRIPDAGPLTQPLAVALAVAWLVIATQIFGSASRDGLGAHTTPMVGSFAIGTWVAASAVMAPMAMLAAPSALWLAKAAFVVSAGLWAWFMPRALRNLARLLTGQGPRPSGIILLSTVATQAVALIALRLYPTAPAMHWFAVALLGLGAVCYFVGLFLVVRRYATCRGWSLAMDWDNSNCILHGALSITGLTAVASGTLDGWAVTQLWLCTSVAFILVEATEVARAVKRVRAFGWRDGVLVYDVSQWARNFTFGMFYAFTAAFAGRFDIAQQHPVLTSLRDQVVGFGQYVVLLLLLAELLLMLRSWGGKLWDVRQRPAN